MRINPVIPQKRQPFIEEEMAIENADPEKIETTTDHRDMVHMGKAQKSKARVLQTKQLKPCWFIQALFSISFNLGIYLYFIEYLGRSIDRE